MTDGRRLEEVTEFRDAVEDDFVSLQEELERLREELADALEALHEAEAELVGLRQLVAEYEGDDGVRS